MPGEQSRVLLSGEGWRCELLAPRRAMLVFRIQGHGTVELARIITEKTAAAFGESNLCLFHDWSGLTGYDAEARTLLVEWARRNLDHIGSVNVLTNSSPVLAMGIAIARMVLRGKFKFHKDRESFEAALLEESKSPR
jgi:hypothetical protein